MPKVQSRIREKKGSKSRYRRLHVKFKDTAPNVVKTARGAVVFAEVFKAKESDRYKSLSHISLPLEASLLDSLTIGPKTIMDLRVALGVSQRNIKSLERRGLVESFWGRKGVGRMFRITTKGSGELNRLKIASSIDSRMIGRPRIAMRKITPLSPV